MQRACRPTMLLPILLISILTSTNAQSLESVIEEILKLDPYQILKIPKLLPETPEDAKLNTMQLISKYGYNGELHKVTTEDGYILELHRITGPATSTDANEQKPVAFVMHGLTCNSAVFVTSGRENSLGFILADAGYDVWLGNVRGSTYSREHTNSKISKKDYWDFSWHEMGTIDLPTMIDYIVKTTGRETMFYIGHSQGTTTFFVMATERPEYQEHIEEMYALAPIAYCGRMKNLLFQFMSQFCYLEEFFRKLIGVYEVNLDNKIIKRFGQVLCGEKAATQPICSNMMFLMYGFNPDQLDPTLLPVILGLIASASTKQFMHYAQLINSGKMITAGRFQQYDYGLRNKEVHGSLTPPEYKLNKITAPMHVYYSENDWLANIKDVEKLTSEVSNLASKTLIADKKFNHLDFVWAKNVKKYLYDPMLNQMDKKRQ
ncbi:lipase 3 [Solenopsis invicta]|uniref:lipase 3 n=1 Tax=Solenopsis invicta TaxID=13686 RepID=UPI00193E4A1A|nr:lipase 3 [Solenopsis invicta]